jgi:hypothetical protein
MIRAEDMDAAFPEYISQQQKQAPPWRVRTTVL